MRRIADEVRTRCFLNCGRSEETGDRALAVKVDDPVKRWRCHQYGCGKGGNLVSLCDLIKPGTNMDDRRRGERFKEIAWDLRAMVEGLTIDEPIIVLAAGAKPAEARREKPPAWSPDMFGGRFRDGQPESLTGEETNAGEP